ncbi:putative reverse transcriptase domain-containing protein [Tanacetum coccineum]
MGETKASVIQSRAKEELLCNLNDRKGEGQANASCYFVSRARTESPEINYTPWEKCVSLAQRKLTAEKILPGTHNYYGSSCIDGSGAGLILTNPKGVEFTYAMRFRFEATNNEAEYEALIAGLLIAEQMSMVQYLEKELNEKTINEKEVLAIVEEKGHIWMTPICEYLTKEILPKDKKSKGGTSQGIQVRRDQWKLIQEIFLGIMAPGADDEEASEGGIPRVIILGYDGLPIQPVAPPSPDYIPGPEDPQTPPVPLDEDEREPMFIQTHDPNYVPEPIYLKYIPLEDEHEFPAEEQPLPPVDSPTAESPGYVTESHPEEDPEEYEDDEMEDGLVEYPMDGGDDGDDDAGYSSRDDANDKDEDDDKDNEEEEEEHLALADSAVVVPTDEPISPPEGTEPVIPPPSTDITIRTRITVRPQTSISLPLEAEVERLLAMTTSSPSPLISLSPPSARECLARYTAPPVHSSPPPVPSPLLPPSGCPTQIQTLKIASTQALIDAVTDYHLLTNIPPYLYIPHLLKRWALLEDDQIVGLSYITNEAIWTRSGVDLIMGVRIEHSGDCMGGG